MEEDRSEGDHQRTEEDRQLVTEKEETKRKSAENLTVRKGANSQRKNVTTNTCVNRVEKVDMEGPRAMPKSTREVLHSMTPKYLRYNVWDPETEFSPSSADWTETAEPLVGIPSSELEDASVTLTIEENLHLFNIVTPI